MTGLIFLFLLLTIFLIVLLRLFMNFFLEFKKWILIIILIYLIINFLIIFYYHSLIMSKTELFFKLNTEFNDIFININFYINKNILIYLFINFIFFSFIVFLFIIYYFDNKYLKDSSIHSIELLNYMLIFNLVSIFFIISNNILLNYLCLWGIQFNFHKLSVILRLPNKNDFNYVSFISLKNFINFIAFWADNLIICSILLIYFYFEISNLDELQKLIHFLYVKEFYITIYSNIIKSNLLDVFYLMLCFGMFIKFLDIIFWFTYLSKFTNLIVSIILIYQVWVIWILSTLFFFKCDFLFEYYYLFSDFIYVKFFYGIFEISIADFPSIFVIILFFFFVIRIFFILYK